MKIGSGRIGQFLAAAGILTAATAWATPGPGVPPAQFNIPRATQSPTIDGRIGAEEWANATVLSGPTKVGFYGHVHPRRTQFFVTWDEQQIYIAGRSEVLPNERLRSRNRAQDSGALVFDDSYEFGFDTLGRSTRPGDDKANYKIVVNFFNRMASQKSLPSIGGFNYAWAPPFERVSKMTEDGRFWELELAMPLSSLEQLTPNEAGMELTMLLGRNYKTPNWFQAAIPVMKSGYFDSAGWPRATLTEGEPFVRVIEGLEKMPFGTAALNMQVVNPGSEPTDVSFESTWTGGEGLEIKKTKTLAPGEVWDVGFEEPVPADKGNAAFTVTAGERTLWQTQYQYEKGAKLQQVQVEIPELTPGTVPLTVEFNPIRSRLRVAADIYRVPWLEKSDTMRWELLDASQQVVATGQTDKQSYFQFDHFQQLPELSPGDYSVRVSLLDEAGNVLGAGEQSVSKVDEEKTFDWLGNDIGNTERVLPPYTAIEVEGDKLSPWGRTFDMNQLGLPEQMIAQGKPLLTGPVRIVVTRDGKTQRIALGGQPIITNMVDHRVRYEGTATGAGLKFTVTGMLEQDGSMLTTLSYEPTDGQPVNLDALAIEYPLVDGEAELMYVVGTGGNYAAKTSDFVPKGQGVVWSTYTIGKPAANMTVGSFFPQAWIGSEKRGFLWWADNDQGWVPNDNVPAHELERRGEELIFRNNIISESYTLDAKRTINFTINATPFKPLRPGWRLLIDNYGRFEHEGDGDRGYKNDLKTKINGWNLLHAPSRDRDEWSEIYAEYKKYSRGNFEQLGYWNSQHRGKSYLGSGVPISGYGTRSLEQDVLDYFAPEWDEAFNISQQDYYLSLMDQWVREGGLTRFYFDITFPRMQDTLLNGMAYVLPDGRIQPGYNLSNMRRFYMRVFAMMTDHGHMPGAFSGHSTNCYQMPCMAWMESVLDGEYNHVKDGSPFEWLDGITETRLRSMSLPATWGVPFDWLIKVQVTDEAEKKRQMRSARGWLRMHDSWGALAPDGYWVFGMIETDVKWTPYWRSEDLVQIDAGQGDVEVSVWQRPDRVLLQVFNTHKTDERTVNLTVDFEKLGLMPVDSIREKIGMYLIDSPGLERGDLVFDAWDGTIQRVPVKGRDYVSIVIQRFSPETEK